MQVTRAMLDEAVTRGFLQREQASSLWGFLCGSDAPELPSFKAAHILYYVGGLIALGAMTLFMTLGWEKFGGQGLLLISVGSFLVALVGTELLLRRDGLKIPAGITAALAVAIVPLGVYGAQHLLGFWPAGVGGEGNALSYHDYHVLIDWRWIFMEAATLTVGVCVLWRYRLPFIVLPIAVTLWYLSMDLTPFLYGGKVSWNNDAGRVVSVVFGLLMLVAAMIVDFRSRKSVDFAFWLYVFGIMTFWGGLTSMDSDSEVNKLIYCLINLAMIAVGAALSRRVFAIFGGIGVAMYLGHLSSTIFKDSMLFPVALTAIGLGVVVAGVYWQRHEDQLGEALRSWLPRELRDRMEHRGNAGLAVPSV